MADERGLCLAESTVWPYHPQVAAARQVFAEAGEHIARVTAHFSFPPIPIDDYRMDSARGGGSLLDLGPYAVSTGRVFYQSEPTEVICRVQSVDAQSGVDTGKPTDAV